MQSIERYTFPQNPFYGHWPQQRPPDIVGLNLLCRLMQLHHIEKKNRLPMTGRRRANSNTVVDTHVSIGFFPS